MTLIRISAIHRETTPRTGGWGRGMTTVEKQRAANRASYIKHKPERSSYQKRYYADNKEAAKARSRERSARMRSAADTWPNDIIYSLRSKCKERGIAFDLTADDIVVPALCPVFDLPFVFGVKGHAQSPSVDRLKPANGYTRGNVRVISRRANAVKHDVTDPIIFERVAAYVRGEL